MACILRDATAVSVKRSQSGPLPRTSARNARSLNPVSAAAATSTSSSVSRETGLLHVASLGSNLRPDEGQRSSREAEGNSLEDGSSEAAFIDFPARRAEQQTSSDRKQPPLVRVRLSVHYRVHSRQMLCIGGSQIPFGWSFLSIAKVPMVWNQGDIWTAEVELPANTRIEYKYVILEEQDWTKLENEDAEGVVSYSFRTEPDTEPPSVQTIQKQMAIVAWQPGPNRVLQVPNAEELSSLAPGEVRERTPAKPLRRPNYSQRQYGQQALGRDRSPIDSPGPPTATGGNNLPPLLAPSGSEPASARRGGSGAPSASHPDGSATWEQQRQQQQQPGQGRGLDVEDELAGTWEELSLAAGGQPLLERRDVWGFPEWSFPEPPQQP